MTRTLLISLFAVLTGAPAFAQDGLPPPGAGGLNHELTDLQAEREIQRTLETAGQEVSRGANKAYQTHDFVRRNQIAAEAISAETAVMAAIRAEATPEQAVKVQRIFEAATSMAGAEFRGAFDQRGQPIASNEATYKEAMSRSGAIALSAMGPLVELVDPGKGSAAQGYAESVVRATRLEDVAKMVAKDLGLRSAPLSGAELTRVVLQLVPEGDWASTLR